MRKGTLFVTGIVWAAVVVVATAGCSSEHGGVVTRVGAITGGDTTNATNDQTTPSVSAVQLFIPDPIVIDPNSTGVSCTGTLFLLDHVLTAAHCFCGNTGPSLGMRTTVTTSAGISIDGSLVGFRENSGACAAFVRQRDLNGQPRPPVRPASDPDPSADLAIVLLDRPFHTDEVRFITRPYTNPDFYDRYCNKVPGPAILDLFGDICRGDKKFFGSPLEIVGFAGGTKNHATVAQGVITTNEVFYNPFGSTAGLWIRAGAEDADARTQPGDSGGPITFHPNGQAIPMQFGVSSIFNPYDIPGITDELSGWCPTWDNGVVADGKTNGHSSPSSSTTPTSTASTTRTTTARPAPARTGSSRRA